MLTGFPLITYLLFQTDLSSSFLQHFMQRQQFWVEQQSADGRGTFPPATPAC